MPQSSTHQRIDASLDDYRWLTGTEAAPLLKTLAASTRPLAAEVTQLRRRLSPARTHLVVEQVELRKRARAKFALAERMFFTPLGLEQASDQFVAAHKARRFRGCAEVFDLCCGIGGDWLALARVAPTTAFDRDPVVTILAEANGRLLSDSSKSGDDTRAPTVCVRDVAQLDAGRCSAWHMDPDRRSGGRRTTRVNLHTPGVEVIERMLAQNPHAAVKLAPAAELPDAWSERAELEWISRDRQCRQLVAWFGNLATDPGRRRATILGNGSTPPRSVVGAPRDDPPASDTLGKYILEPDAAVLAAGLGPTLAAEHGLAPIAAGIAYWTGDRSVNDPALACFEVCDVLPLDLKRVRALLRERNIGRLEIKKRGVDHEPHKLRRQLGLAGQESATLFVTRVRGRVTAILARRVTSCPSPAMDGDRDESV